MITREAIADYLLDQEVERGVIEVHRHKILLAPAAGLLAAAVLAAIVASRLVPAAGGWPWLLVLAAGGWFWWRWLNWRCYWFVLTTARIIVASGVFSHNIGLMPLNRLTDMSFRESWIGQRLGWGKIVVESAGQDQALHVINWLSRPRELYLEISNQVFGDDE